MKTFGLLALVMATGCYGDNIQLDGTHYQYVVSELRVPSTSTMSRLNGLDLNGDQMIDNQLGMVFGSLNGFGLGVGETAQEALLRGGLVMLADLETTDFTNTDLAGFTTYLGADPVPEPCVDPARLETCGQHVLGIGHFTVDLDSASDLASGPIRKGVYGDLVGLMPVEIAIDSSTPIRLDLHGARVRLSQMSEGHISGILGGGISKADIVDVVIPQAAAQMDRIVVAECTAPGHLPCGCLGRAKTLQEAFDDNDDCRIEVREVSSSSLVQALLAPDVTIGRQDFLSFGVGVELASATFTTP